MVRYRCSLGSILSCVSSHDGTHQRGTFSFLEADVNTKTLNKLNLLRFTDCGFLCVYKKSKKEKIYTKYLKFPEQISEKRSI